jgi:hypothetical protein
VSREDIKNLLTKLSPYKTEHQLIRIGPNRDGGYLVPDDLENIKACFSPGVSDYAHFEEDLLKRYGINSFQADFSVEGPPQSFEPLSFTKKFLGSFNNDKFITALIGNTQIIELLEATFGDYYECISNSKNIDNTKKLIVFKKDINKLDKTLYENIEMGNLNILISCNKLPTLDNNIVMKEKFRVINIVNNNQTINFNEYKNDFMLLLIDNYKKYVNQKHIIPTINNMGWSARKNIDIYLYFVKECMETSTNHIDMDVLYEYFKQWYVKNISYLSALPMKRKFVKEIKKHKLVVDVKFDGKSRIGIRFTQIKA